MYWRQNKIIILQIFDHRLPNYQIYWILEKIDIQTKIG